MQNLLVVGYPKSGNTWLNFLLAYYFNVPYLDAPQEEQYLSGQTGPPGYKERAPIQGGNNHETDDGSFKAIIKSHHLPEEISERYPKVSERYNLDCSGRVIMIVRDP